MEAKIKTKYFTAKIRNERGAGIIRVTLGDVPRYPDYGQMAILNSFNGPYEYHETRQSALGAIQDRIERTEIYLNQLKAAAQLAKRKTVKIEVAPVERMVWKIDRKELMDSIHLPWGVRSWLDAYASYKDLPKTDYIEYRIKERETE